METEKRINQEKKQLNCPKLLDLYYDCKHNAIDLLDEAKILLSNKRFARAYFLAYSAIEEIGKSQIVADYFYDIVSEKEFKETFSDHRLKSAYNFRILDISNSKAILKYNKKDIQELFDKRGNSLYVDYNDTTILKPDKKITMKDAHDIIKLVQELLDEIFHAEWLNQRIGSKGLFK